MKSVHDPEIVGREAKEAAASALTPDRLRAYLENRFQQPVRVEEMRELTGKTRGAEALKKFGYGRPFLVKCRTGEVERRLVFHRIRRNGFGREREDDRVAAVWLDFRTFGRLPRHAAAEDMIVRSPTGELRSIRDAQEMLLVTDYRPGTPYAEDLMRLRDEPLLHPADLRRAELLAAYLAEIHSTKNEAPEL